MQIQKSNLVFPSAVTMHRLYLLQDYPVLAALAATRTSSTKLDGRACAQIYSDALAETPWLSLTTKELVLMRDLGVARTRAELIQAVPIHHDPEANQRRFIVIGEIPSPWREQFNNDLYGAACPGFDGLGPCAFYWDWDAWVNDLWYGGVMRPLGLMPGNMKLPNVGD